METAQFKSVKRPTGVYFDNLSYSEYRRNSDGENVEIKDDFTIRAYKTATKYIFAYYAPDFEKNGCPYFLVAAFSIDQKNVDNVKQTMRYLIENSNDFI